MKLAWMVVVMSVVGSSLAYADKVEEPVEPAPPTATPPTSTLSAGTPVMVSTTTTAPAPEKSSGPHITVMWAPIMLVVPVGEITIEYAVMKKLGVSIEAGFGKRTVTDGANNDYTGTEIEAGGQVRYYALGDFHKGLELGVQLLEEHVNFKDLPSTVAVAAGGLTVGPFVGYKIATKVGFTFEAQLGPRYVLVMPPVQGAAAAPPMDISKWGPLLHLNVGWSF